MSILNVQAQAERVGCAKLAVRARELRRHLTLVAQVFVQANLVLVRAIAIRRWTLERLHWHV